MNFESTGVSWLESLLLVEALTESAEKARKFADIARPYVQLLLRNRLKRELLERIRNLYNILLYKNCVYANVTTRIYENML